MFASPLQSRCIWLQAWQGRVFDALAAWLDQDPNGIQPRLRQQDAMQRFVALFASYNQNADSEALARPAGPILKDSEAE